MAPEGVPAVAHDEGADLAERQVRPDQLPGHRLLLGAEEEAVAAVPADAHPPTPRTTLQARFRSVETSALLPGTAMCLVVLPTVGVIPPSLLRSCEMMVNAGATVVVRDMTEIETASFWYDSPEVRRGELSPATIATEVFLMPAAGHAEKDGTFTNTQRLLQWHEKAVDPPGDARSESWFMYHLGRRLKAMASAISAAVKPNWIAWRSCCSISPTP